MNRLNLKEWHEPFQMSEELRTADYEAAFNPRLPRRTARTYERSAQRCMVIRGAVGGSDPFRVKYCHAIAEQMAKIVRARVRHWAKESLIETDRKHFVAAAEETLVGINEGNFARYRLISSEFDVWKAIWTETCNQPT